jgi:hypothetical protein
MPWLQRTFCQKNPPLESGRKIAALQPVLGEIGECSRDGLQNPKSLFKQRWSSERPISEERGLSRLTRHCRSLNFVYSEERVRATRRHNSLILIEPKRVLDVRCFMGNVSRLGDIDRRLFLSDEAPF